MATDIEVFDSRTGTTRIDTATACFMWIPACRFQYPNRLIAITSSITTNTSPADAVMISVRCIILPVHNSSGAIVPAIQSIACRSDLFYGQGLAPGVRQYVRSQPDVRPAGDFPDS